MILNHYCKELKQRFVNQGCKTELTALQNVDRKELLEVSTILPQKKQKFC